MTLEAVGISFWEFHSICFIIFMLFFPRLTMIFSSIFCFNPLFLLGWLLFPRLTVAIIATFLYFPTNPILCVLTWIWALNLEYHEKNTICETIL